MTTIVTGQFVTISSVTVGGNMSVGSDARISGNTTIAGDLLVGGGLVYNGATMCANGITLSGDINIIGLHGVEVTADAATNTLTISGGGGGSGFPNPANADLNMSNFGILNVSGINFQNQSVINNLSQLNFQSFGGGGGSIGSVRQFINGNADWQFISGGGIALNICGNAYGTYDANSGALSNLTTTFNTIGGVTLQSGNISLNSILSLSASVTNTTNGYFDIGGVRVQWGYVAGPITSPATGQATITLTQPFANAYFFPVAIASQWSNDQLYNNYAQIGFQSFTSNSFQVNIINAGAGQYSSNASIYYIAIGQHP